MIIFITIVLLVWTAMHSYVFWRVSTVPWVATRVSRRTILITAAILWLSYPLSRFLEGRAPDWFVFPLEWLAANWVGFLFLQLSILLVADLVTLGGFVFRERAGHIRGVASVLALALGLFAVVQGHRKPGVTDYQVELSGLPAELDGTVLISLSDTHLGTLIRKAWLERLVSQVNALEPDVVVAVGDIVDGDADRVQHLAPVLRRLRPPLGIWTVTGNHEYYAGVRECIEFFEASGMRVLRNESAEAAPGLVFAGVDDLTAKRQFGGTGNGMAETLSGRPEGATVLLSHTPWKAEEAAAAGAGLMISGHTHNGQIWPFTYFVRLRYPLVSGLYEVGDMKVIVGRGAGTWGPRMRLWKRGEILRITLRAPSGQDRTDQTREAGTGNHEIHKGGPNGKMTEGV
jgi:uncharacterized protein